MRASITTKIVTCAMCCIVHMMFAAHMHSRDFDVYLFARRVNTVLMLSILRTGVLGDSGTAMVRTV